MAQVDALARTEEIPFGQGDRVGAGRDGVELGRGINGEVAVNQIASQRVECPIGWGDAHPGGPAGAAGGAHDGVDRLTNRAGPAQIVGLAHLVRRRFVGEEIERGRLGLAHGDGKYSKQAKNGWS
jgi:hypothetical protein